MTVLRNNAIRIVDIGRHCFLIVTLDISKSNMLIKVSSKPITAFLCSKVAATDPRPAVNEIVFTIIDRYRKIIIDRICLLYTSDAADEEDSVDLGGRRI